MKHQNRGCNRLEGLSSMSVAEKLPKHKLVVHDTGFSPPSPTINARHFSTNQCKEAIQVLSVLVITAPKALLIRFHG